VLLGIARAAAKLLYTFSHLDAYIETTGDGSRTTLILRGSATFVRLPRLATMLGALPSGGEVHVDLEHLSYIDHACLDLLKNWTRQHEANGGSVVLDWESLHARNQSNGNGRPATGPNKPRVNGDGDGDGPVEKTECRSA
jgi:ABC-type transporter Mla MlaB component